MGLPYAEVIGDPIAHSKSPLIHTFWLERLGLAGEFRRTRVATEGLEDFLGRRRADSRWRGCSVTFPHKQTVIPLLDECRLWGVEAVNCIVPEEGRLIGYNTDVDGVAKALPGVETWAPVCLIGAGGAARAAIAHLDILAVYQFNLIARDLNKAGALISPYGEQGRAFQFDRASDAMTDCIGLINATPLGMEGFDPMPEAVLASLGSLRSDAFVLDMVYAPVETELLRQARALGLATADGLTMLIGQAEPAFERFFGTAPPGEQEARLRELLTR